MTAANSTITPQTTTTGTLNTAAHAVLIAADTAAVTARQSLPNARNQHRRILAVQSHVVHGYVGNKAATLPLQLAGFDVDPLNVLQFSTHTGYGAVVGAHFAPNDVRAILTTLLTPENDHHTAVPYSHILTGYVGKPETLTALADAISKCQQKHTNNNNNVAPVVIIDPVMGDDGKLYVHEDVVAHYRDSLLPLADVTTPNGFETSVLTGIDVCNDESATNALTAIHALGPRIAVITSSTVDEDPIDDITNSDNTMLALYASDSKTGESFAIRFARRHGHFTGTGDLFAAAFTAAMDRHNVLAANALDIDKTTPNQGPLARSCIAALAIVQSVLAVTAASAGDTPPPTRRGAPAEQLRAWELALIDSRSLLANDPPIALVSALEATTTRLPPCEVPKRT